MRIFQLLPVLYYGDAVGNDAIALKEAIEEMGYETEIYAENIDSRLSKKTAKNLKEMPEIKDSDVMIYHLATGTHLNYEFAEYRCKKIVIYHNITPPHFFDEYNEVTKRLCAEGLEGAVYLSDKADYCLADSKFNKENLREMGYQCTIDVLPILIAFEDYDKKPNSDIIKKYDDDGYVNIIFTGRIAPNKKQEDIIKAFYYYKTYINDKSRLFLIGSYNGMNSYYSRLKNYVEALNLEDVIFTGHIKFDKILAYYKIADVFLCLSEHEGFCVPLLEAMYFGVPIIAYDNTAVGDTLGEGGILIKDKDPKIVAEMIHRLAGDQNLKDIIKNNQKIKLQDFSNSLIKNKFEKYLKDFIGEL